MYLEHLGLRDYRNYRELELSLPRGLSLFSGANAQGKSNLLEAIYTLALTRSHRAENERQVVRFAAPGEASYTRVLGVVRRGSGEETRVQVDMALGPPRASPDDAPTLQKRIRVNGVPRSAAGALGNVAAVLFSAEDLGLVTGPPSGRRRYLDVLLSQTDRGYMRSLQRYQRVLAQRNHLLRRIREGQAGAGELPFWDGELTFHGARLTLARRQAVDALAPWSRESYGRLAEGEGPLEVQYRPAVDVESADTQDSLSERLGERLVALRDREVRLGQTLAGPHRDDLKFLVGGVDMGQYGSRGQVRTVALALRLAEARHLAATLGDEPILLLDDVLSELDGARRREVLGAAHQAQQALLTMVDAEQDAGAARRAAARFRVAEGTVVALHLATGREGAQNGPVEEAHARNDEAKGSEQ